MQRKTPLKSKRPLVARQSLKKAPPKPRKRLKLEQKSAAQLVEPADKAFSKYIRLRDSERRGDQWVGTCITCPREMVVYYADESGKMRWNKGPQNGHLIGRGTFSLRYDEENCNLQCAHCNAWLDKDEMIERYREAVDLKYGDGTYKKLKAASVLEGARKKPTKAELLQIISDSNARLDFLLSH